MTNKYLVFTSAGESNNIKKWLPATGFDLIIIDYTNNAALNGIYNTKIYRQRKAGKFQNLHHFFLTERENLENYQYIMVSDDDMEMSSSDILRLFNFADKNKFKISQPGFSIDGKVSHSITIARPYSLYRLTNFVEVTCPIFEKNCLFDFLMQFDPEANGGGVDYWFCNNAIKEYGKSSIAIIDFIVAKNPQDVSKKHGREIDLFQSREKRNQAWLNVVNRNDLTIDTSKITYNTIYSISTYRVFSFIFTWVIFTTKRILRKIGIAPDV